MDERSEVEFMRCGLTILVALGLLGGGVATESRAQAQPREPPRFVGRVYDEAGRPVDQVEVIVNRREVRATSNGFGLFHLDLAPDDSTVGFRRIGYRPLLLSLNPLPRPADTILVELVPSPVQLEEVIVTGSPSKPLRYAGTTKYDDVFERRKIGLGKLISREDIYRRPGARTYELLEGLAGIRVYGPPLERIRFTRCTTTPVDVYIDGVRQLGGDAVEKLARVTPLNIEMIEVFRSPSEIPGVFQGSNCAVIAVWTRSNE